MNNPSYQWGMPQQMYYPNSFSQPVQQPNYVGNQVSLPTQQNGSQRLTDDILGHTVTNIAEVVPNEVPMNGNFAVFPLKDFSCIYAKAWNSDGTIKTIKFIPEPDVPVVDEKKDEFNTALFQKLESIEKTLSKITMKKEEKSK